MSIEKKRLFSDYLRMQMQQQQNEMSPFGGIIPTNNTQAAAFNAVTSVFGNITQPGMYSTAPPQYLVCHKHGIAHWYNEPCPGCVKQKAIANAKPPTPEASEIRWLKDRVDDILWDPDYCKNKGHKWAQNTMQCRKCGVLQSDLIMGKAQ